MFGCVDTAALCGFGAARVRVEVDILRGLPSFQVVGLAENSVKEARVRVQSSIVNAGYQFPKGKIFVNLAPADVQKSGTNFDVAMACALLMATGVLPKEKMDKIAVIGELSLAGEILPVRGMLALAESIKEQGFQTLLVAEGNAQEANLISGLTIKIVHTLSEVLRAVVKEEVHLLASASFTHHHENRDKLDMEDVIGQEEARRALLIAAAGDHNLVFVGGPGSGKSMMAHRLPSILPPLSDEEALMLTKIYSIAGLTLSGQLIADRPFRAPHHSITRAGLSGGGSKFIRPGEISLACFGVLFLDEILEFPRAVLEVLRQPLELGFVTLSRANSTVTYPAKISMIAAYNPCPCGFFGQRGDRCTCVMPLVERYQNRLSGPLADRIDIYVNVPPVDLRLMYSETKGESSTSMRTRVLGARKRQHTRLRHISNGKMARRHIKESARLHREAHEFLIRCGEKLLLSARGYDRIIKVARTIADLDESDEIFACHIGEALHFRRNTIISAQSIK